ncbi:MAG: ABC transporter substrate-binding protein [Sneathiellaceae bacterium]
MKPKRGGTLKVAVGGGSSTNSFDPTTYDDFVMNDIAFQYANRLTQANAKGVIVPDLAESWEATPDARVWRFHLRKGVEFHNGKPLEAEDAVWSINLHRGKDSKSAAKALLTAVTDVRAEGKNVVVVELDGGNADLPAIMADYHLMILPHNLPADAGVGTGAFVKEMFEPGVRWAATRNPNYWDGDRPYVDAVELSVVNDPTARLAALRSGQAHMINRVDAKTVSLLKRDDNVQILRSPAWAHYTLPMHCDKAPFDNQDLRLAMKYAYDREQMLTQILRGYGSLGNDTPIAPTNPYFNAEMPQRTYDPDKAAFHYKKSGHEGPLQVHTSDAAFAGAIDAAVLFKENAAKAGITVDVVRDPADGYWSDVWLKVPACYVFWAGRPTPDMIFSTAYAKDAAWNEAKWDNAAFNELLIKARAELDFDKRKAMYAEMQTLVNTDGGTIVPVFNDWLDAGTTAVKGYEPHPLFDFSGHKAAEKVWLEEG